MDGWQFAQAYHEQPGPHAPIIVVTAAREASERAAQIGAEGVLPSHSAWWNCSTWSRHTSGGRVANQRTTALGKITGETASDAILEAVFLRYCIGK